MPDLIIKSTSDYEKFNFLSANREQNVAHIARLKRAFEEYGNLTKVQPVTVNENWEVIDGQHRVTVCAEMGLPVFYIMTPGLRIEDARNMNVLHRGWTVDDYAHTYATAGVPSYVKYLELYEAYPFGHKTLLHALATNTRNIYRTFKEGDFTIDEDGLEVTIGYLDMLSETAPLVPFNGHPVEGALLRAFTVDGYDHDKMLKKLARFGDSMVKMNNSGDNLRQLEDIYNRGTQEQNRVRFF